MSEIIKPTLLSDYQPPCFLIDQTDIDFQLDAAATEVTTVTKVRVNPDNPPTESQLMLDGEGLTLLSVAIDGQPLKDTDYTRNETSLLIHHVPAQFTLTIVTRIHPQANTALSGLYTSQAILCTQCEAQGFRRITYYLDRPDVLSRFTTTITANKKNYPVLLSNGNLVEQQSLDSQRHRAKWEDPFPKPCYLFALVAGDLAKVDDRFTTMTGREVSLHIYVAHGQEDKCDFAMQSLKRAMRWDEERFGREYDLGMFNIVAVNDFNAGAMENKSLNIFNAQYILAKPETATDMDTIHIESVVAHEYFHNWTGNRVTCRDWFQLSLKEGLTVYRDQEFSADQWGRDVMRIHTVKRLREYQFVEDAGPTAHPVQPESYLTIDNFYTPTVYEKGAELIRMLETLLGKEGFRRGMDNYFERYDGCAVTIEALISAMETANHTHLEQFRLWYHQAGTPTVTILPHYDETHGNYTLEVSQSLPDMANQIATLPMCIPLEIALFEKHHDHYELTHQQVLKIVDSEQTFCFQGIHSKPLLSQNRHFSAPVKVVMDYQDHELLDLLLCEENGFSQWEAAQLLAKRYLLRMIRDQQEGRKIHLSKDVLQVYQRVLTHESLDDALKAELLLLPSEAQLATEMKIIDVDAIHQARQYYQEQMATYLRESLLKVYRYYQLKTQDQAMLRKVVGSRALKNICLHYLMLLDDEQVRRLAMQQLEQASNMTNELAALTCLANSTGEQRELAIEAFYQKWRDEALVMNKWFSVQATSRRPDTLLRVKALLHHPAYDAKNPNNVRALVGCFTRLNPALFHAINGEGYAFLTEQVLMLDKLNPQVAAYLVTPMLAWYRHEEKRANSMKHYLNSMLDHKRLSKNVYERVDKSLNRSRI